MSPIAARLRNRLAGSVWTFALVGGGAVLGMQVTRGGLVLRIVGAVGVMVLLAIPAIENPRWAMYALFWWLPFLGLARRLLLSSAGAAPLDPLLLVTSAVSLVIFTSLLLSRRANLGGTALSRLVFYLLMIGVVQIFNPLQGGILVGLTGVMFVLVPVMCFFIGRSVADETLVSRMQRQLLVIGVGTALYGMFQVFFGLRGFEKAYVAASGPISLRIGSTIRPFSTFTNTLEYATYLGFAICVAVAALLYARGMARYLLVFAAGVMGYGGFLIGSRGFVVGTLAAVTVLIGMRARHRAASVLIVVALVAGGMYWSATRTASDEPAKQKGAPELAKRQEQALKDPFDRSKSTLPGHLSRVRDGFVYAFTKAPMGFGIGITSRGGRKFGGEELGTELDVSNAALAFGALGGLLYVGIILTALVQLERLRRLVGGAVWPAILGMAIVSLGQWLNGGNYAVAPLIWFMLGAADAAYHRARMAPVHDLVPHRVAA